MDRETQATGRPWDRGQGAQGSDLGRLPGERVRESPRAGRGQATPDPPLCRTPSGPLHFFLRFPAPAGPPPLEPRSPPTLACVPPSLPQSDPQPPIFLGEPPFALQTHAPSPCLSLATHHNAQPHSADPPSAPSFPGSELRILFLGLYPFVVLCPPLRNS